MIESNIILTTNSSNIHSIAYDEDIETLEVEFKNGGVYQYFDFPENMWNQFKNDYEAGGSAGKFLNDYIKGRFRYSKV